MSQIPADPLTGHRIVVRALGDISIDDVCCLDYAARTVRKAPTEPGYEPFTSRPEPCLARDDIAKGERCIIDMLGNITRRSAPTTA